MSATVLGRLNSSVHLIQTAIWLWIPQISGLPENRFPRVKTVPYDGLFDVRFIDRDRLDQDGRNIDPAVINEPRGLRFLALSDRDRCVDGGRSKLDDRLVNGHRLRAGDDPLKCPELGVLSGNQNFAG